jgi:hypothetical protein
MIAGSLGLSTQGHGGSGHFLSDLADEVSALDLPSFFALESDLESDLESGPEPELDSDLDPEPESLLAPESFPASLLLPESEPEAGKVEDFLA